jgi:transposase InsO family protein
MHCAAGIDFLVVPTVTFNLLYVFVVLDHARRRIVHVNVTEQPCARWAAQQVIEAFPFDTAPRYLHRDRDSIFGSYFKARIRGMGIEQVLSAPRAPWQNPYAERVIGSMRRTAPVTRWARMLPTREPRSRMKAELSSPCHASEAFTIATIGLLHEVLRTNRY